MKKFLALFLLLFSVQSVCAKQVVENTTIGGINYCLYDDMTAAVSTNNSVNFGASGVCTIPATVRYNNKNYNVTETWDYAFSGTSPSTMANKTLKVLNLPSTIEKIGPYAFSGCPNLVEVNLEDNMNLQIIGDKAFNNAPVKSFDFEKCTRLTTIGNTAFYGSKIEKVYIPASVESIDYSAFGFCNNLEEVIFQPGSNLKVMGLSAFASCKNLSRVELGEGLEYLGSSAFAYTPKLTSFTIPSTMKKIKAYMFAGYPTAEGLQELICLAPTPPEVESGGSGIFNNPTGPEGLVFKVPAASLNDYKTAPYWKDLTNIQPIVAATDIYFDRELPVPDIEPYSSLLYFIMKGGPADLQVRVKPDDVDSRNMKFTFEENGAGTMTRLAADKVRITPTVKNSVMEMSYLTVASTDGSGLEKKYIVYYTDLSRGAKPYIYSRPAASSTQDWTRVQDGLTLRVGESVDLRHQLTADFPFVNMPEVTWTVDDEVAMVETNSSDSQLATITGLHSGTATLSVRMPDGVGVNEDIPVKILAERPMTSLGLSPERFSMAPDAEPVAVKALFEPADASEVGFEWTVSPEDIVRIEPVEDDKGSVKIVPLQIGQVILTAVATDGSELTAKTEITVKEVKLENITVGEGLTTVEEIGNVGLQTADGPVMAPDNEIVMRVGQTASVVAFRPEDIDFPASIVCNVADVEVAEATYDGTPARGVTFEALTVGRTSFTVSTGEETVGGTIRVIAADPVISLELEPSQVSVPLNCDVPEITVVSVPEQLPENVLVWSTSDPDVATVDPQTGEITLVGTGEARITAATTDGTELTAAIDLTVTDKIVKTLSVEPAELSFIVGREPEITLRPDPADGVYEKIEFSLGEEAADIISVEQSESDPLTFILKASWAAEADLTFTITTSEGEVTAVCPVTARIVPVESITLSAAGSAIALGESITLEAGVSPADATLADLDWSCVSSDGESLVPQADDTGRVTFVPTDTGRYTVTAKSKDGSDVEGRFEFTVYSLAVTASFSSQALVGEELALTAVIEPAFDAAVYQWTLDQNESDKIEIIGDMTEATLRFRGLSAGDISFRVTAEVEDGLVLRSSALTANLKYPPLRSIKMEQTLDLRSTQTAVLHPVADPEYALLEGLEWSTDNPDVATVDADGTITARSAGQARISATVPASELTGDADVTASCLVTVKPLFYTVEYLVDGKNYATREYEYGSSIELPDAPAKKGHTFLGWDGLPDDLKMPEENLTANALFEVNQYTAYFYIDDKLYRSVKVNYGEPIEVPDVEIPEGHEFSGWDIKVPDTMPAGDLEFRGTFNRRSFHVSFFIDGQLRHEADVLYGEPIEEPEVVEPEGHEFSGWDIKVPDTMPAGDLEFRGTFNRRSFHVSFFIDGQLRHEADVLYGEPIEEPEVVEPEGREFSGWDIKVPDTMPAGDLEFRGTFNRRSFHVSFYIDGELYHEADVLYGEPIEEPEVDVPQGYEFRGWDRAIPDTMPAEDLEFYGTMDKTTGVTVVPDEIDKVDVYDLRGVRVLTGIDEADIKGRLNPGVYILVEPATGRRVKFAVK